MIFDFPALVFTVLAAFYFDAACVAWKSSKRRARMNSRAALPWAG
jgi:hypothetical protein